MQNSSSEPLVKRTKPPFSFGEDLRYSRVLAKVMNDGVLSDENGYAVKVSSGHESDLREVLNQTQEAHRYVTHYPISAYWYFKRITPENWYEKTETETMTALKSIVENRDSNDELEHKISELFSNHYCYAGVINYEMIGSQIHITVLAHPMHTEDIANDIASHRILPTMLYVLDPEKNEITTQRKVFKLPARNYQSRNGLYLSFSEKFCMDSHFLSWEQKSLGTQLSMRQQVWLGRKEGDYTSFAFNREQQFDPSVQGLKFTLPQPKLPLFPFDMGHEVGNDDRPRAIGLISDYLPGKDVVDFIMDNNKTLSLNLYISILYNTLKELPSDRVHGDLAFTNVRLLNHREVQDNPLAKPILKPFDSMGGINGELVAIPYGLRSGNNHSPPEVNSKCTSSTPNHPQSIILKTGQDAYAMGLILLETAPFYPVFFDKYQPDIDYGTLTVHGRYTKPTRYQTQLKYYEEIFIQLERKHQYRDATEHLIALTHFLNQIPQGILHVIAQCLKPEKERICRGQLELIFEQWQASLEGKSGREAFEVLDRIPTIAKMHPGHEIREVTMPNGRKRKVGGFEPEDTNKRATYIRCLDLSEENTGEDNIDIGPEKGKSGNTPPTSPDLKPMVIADSDISYQRESGTSQETAKSMSM